jgi:Tfp pilus assembly ATPase PilU
MIALRELIRNSENDAWERILVLLPQPELSQLLTDERLVDLTGQLKSQLRQSCRQTLRKPRRWYH